MSRLSSAVLGSGVLLLSLSTGLQSWAQDAYGQPGYRPYYQDDGRYYPPRVRGYGSSQDDLIGRVMFDLNQAASRAYLDNHERKHFDEVAEGLQDFQFRWSRGKFDTGKLDKAIHNLEHLAHADRVYGRDRERLTRDLYDLRRFRDTRGGYYGSPGYYPLPR